MKAYDEEFDQFVGSAWPRLRQAAFALTGHTADAEDLLQGVLARAYAGWPRIRRGDPVAYVRRALVNAYIDTCSSSGSRRATTASPTPGSRRSEA